MRWNHLLYSPVSLASGWCVVDLQLENATHLVKMPCLLPNLATLQLSNLALAYSDLQGLSRLTNLQSLHLQDVSCTRTTFSQWTTHGSRESVFTHMQPVTALDMQQNSTWSVEGSTKFVTEDLQGLSLMTSLCELCVKTVYMPRKISKDGIRIRFVNIACCSLHATVATVTSHVAPHGQGAVRVYCHVRLAGTTHTHIS